MSKTTIVVITITGMALGTTLITSTQSRGIKDELEQAHAQIAELQSASAKSVTSSALVRNAELETSQMAQELEQARSQILILQEEVSLRKAAADRLEETVESFSEAAEKTARKSALGEEEYLKEEWGKQGWEREEWIQATTQMEVGHRYGRLFAMLQLPAELEFSARALLAENVLDDPDEWKPGEGSVVRDRLRTVLASVLTQEELDTWEHYEDSYFQFSMEQLFATELRNLGPGLTPANREMATLILADELTLAQNSLRAFGNAGDSASELAAWQTAYEQSRARLGEVLDEEQFWELERFLQEQEGELQVKEDLMTNVWVQESELANPASIEVAEDDTSKATLDK